jgi:hypothetical protein
MRNNLLLTWLSVCLLAPAVLSQEAAPQQAVSLPGGQAQTQPNRMGPGGGMAIWFLRDLERNVKLRDDQKAQMRDVLDKLRQEAASQFRNNPPDPQARETFRALRQQLQEAAAASQDYKVAEIQKQLDGRGGGNAFSQMRARAMDEVEKVLDPGQKRAFQEWRSLRESPVPGPLLANPDTLKTTIGSIPTLTDIQKNALDAAIERYQRQVDAIGQDDPVILNALRNRMASQIQEVLKPSQQVLLANAWGQQMRARNATQPSGRRGGAPPWATSSAPTAMSSRREIDPQNTDAWTTYVQTFVARYRLDTVQSEASYSILKELHRRAAEFASSHTMDLAYLEQQSQEAASPDDQAAIDRDRRALLQPIAGMFQELKDRLDMVPTEAQRATANRPVPASRPTRSRPSPATQPAVSMSLR